MCDGQFHLSIDDRVANYSPITYFQQSKGLRRITGETIINVIKWKRKSSRYLSGHIPSSNRRKEYDHLVEERLPLADDTGLLATNSKMIMYSVF